MSTTTEPKVSLEKFTNLQKERTGPRPLTVGDLMKALKFCKDFITMPKKYRETLAIPFIATTVPNIIFQLNNTKDAAYGERNKLVAYLTTLYPSHIAKHPEDDKDWDEEWRNIVIIETPKGQASWHVHDSDMVMFRHLGAEGKPWDGHTTEEKYERLVGELVQQEEKQGA